MHFVQMVCRKLGTNTLSTPHETTPIKLHLLKYISGVFFEVQMDLADSMLCFNFYKDLCCRNIFAAMGRV